MPDPSPASFKMLRGLAAGVLLGVIITLAVFFRSASDASASSAILILAIATLCVVLALVLLRPELCRAHERLAASVATLGPRRLKLLRTLSTVVVLVGFIWSFLCAFAAFLVPWIAGSWPIPLGLLIMGLALIAAALFDAAAPKAP